MKRPLIVGFLLWLGASLLPRLAPASLLRPEKASAIVVLYAVSFGLMYFVLRRLTTQSSETYDGPRAGIALLLPTLVLDAFASAFFPSFYPNLPAGAAGVFGGWMLISCGGGLAALIRAR